jgi:hypothetical protein
MTACQGVMMRTQHTNIIDKTRPSGYDRGMLSRASGREQGRVGHGCCRGRGLRMVRVINRGDSFFVRLPCRICGERCRLSALWLAFPPGEEVDGYWVHRDCVSSRVESTFGVRRLVLMRGEDALRRVAEGLEEAADPSLVKRPKATRPRPLPGAAAVTQGLPEEA